MYTKPDNLSDAIKYLFSLQKFGIKLGLSSTENLLKRLGNPHHNMNFIHVAGTNGKGSVSAMLSSILSGLGKKTGLFTSPHLIKMNERFRINESEIDDDRLLKLIRDVFDVVDHKEPATFFEYVTVMALKWFKDEGVEWGIMEVGLGGRLDATNIITPALSIITNISMDHEEHLGDNLLSIAREKAGIIKSYVPAVLGRMKDDAVAVMNACAMGLDAPLSVFGRDYHIKDNNPVSKGFNYYGTGWKIKNVIPSLKGEHQADNAALVLRVMEMLDKELNIQEPETVLPFLNKVNWPARFEIISHDPLLIFDSAHNPDGIIALGRTLKQVFPGRKFDFVIGVMSDKAYEVMLDSIFPVANSFYFTRPQYERATNPDKLKRMIVKKGIHVESLEPSHLALEKAMSETGKKTGVCVTGSLYLLGELKAYLKDHTPLKQVFFR